MTTSAAVNLTAHPKAPDPDVASSPLPDVPPRAVLRDRREVDTSGDIWRMRNAANGGKVVRFNWSLLDASAGTWVLPARERQLVRLYVHRELRRSSPRSAYNAYNHLLFIIRWFVAHLRRSAARPMFVWRELRYGDMVALLHALTDTAERGAPFNRLRHFYAWGVREGLPDFDPRVLGMLKVVRAQGNVKGAAVRSKHPTHGPLTSQEAEALARGVMAGLGNDEDRALVMLMRELGPNPFAVVRLRNEHLLRYAAPSSRRPGQTVVRYQLRVHRIKKRVVLEQFRTCPISTPLGDLLSRLKMGGPGDTLLHWLAADNPESDLTLGLQRWAAEAGVISARTGEALHLTARRLRYSLGTEVADDGYSPEYLRVALDHSDHQNLNVYVDASPGVLAHVSDRLDPKLAPIVGHFLGTIVSDADGGADPGPVVPGTAVELPEVPLDLGGIGSCGRDVTKDGLCGKGGVLGCYTCPHFQAFVDGPHERVAQSLAAAQERLARAGERGVAQQITPCLQAVQQLLVQIEARRPGGAV